MSDSVSIPIAKTYVAHDSRWFFVSTIERSCSAVLAHDQRYNETMVWEYDMEKMQRGDKILGQYGQIRGSLRAHQRVVDHIFDYGTVPEE